MLAKWLTARPSRMANKDYSFRPSLESLEERNAPSGHGPGGDNDHGDHDHGPHGPPPPPTVNASQSSSVNAHGSFNNSTITDSFNNTMSVVVNLPAAQSGAVGGLMGISNLLSSALSNPQLGTLLNDEIALAVDNYLTSTPVASLLGSNVVTALKNDATTLASAIAANPLESNPIGAAVGTMVYNFTSSALMSTSLLNP